MIVDTVGSDGSNIPTRASGERFAEKRGMLVSITEESLMPFWAEVLIRHREKWIKEFFGVCLVSIIGEHQRDYRESERL